MEVINTKKIASVNLAEVLISADEIEVYQTALELALDENVRTGNRKTIRRDAR